MMQRLLAFLAIGFAFSTSQAAPIPTFEVESGTLCQSPAGNRSAFENFKFQIETYSPDFVILYAEYEKSQNNVYQLETKYMVVVKKPVSIQDFTTSGNSMNGSDRVCAKIVHVK